MITPNTILIIKTPILRGIYRFIKGLESFGQAHYYMWQHILQNATNSIPA